MFEKNVGVVPSYMRGTLASECKRRTKVVRAPKPAPPLSKNGIKRSRVAARERPVATDDLEGYQRLTKAAQAKVSPRTYVLQVERVEVPKIALVEYEAAEEDVAWLGEKMQAKADMANEVLFDVDRLFVGRHDYYDDKGVLIQPRDSWKEVWAEQYGIEWNEFRICRNYSLNIEDYDDVE